MINDIYKIPDMACLYYLEKHHLLFLETSALESTNVEAAFNTVLTGNSKPMQTCRSCPNKKHIPLVVLWAVWVTLTAIRHLSVSRQFAPFNVFPSWREFLAYVLCFWYYNICAAFPLKACRPHCSFFQHDVNVSFLLNSFATEIHRKVGSKEVVRGAISALSLNNSRAENTEEKKPCCRNIWSQGP